MGVFKRQPSAEICTTVNISFKVASIVILMCCVFANTEDDLIEKSVLKKETNTTGTLNIPSKLDHVKDQIEKSGFEKEDKTSEVLNISSDVDYIIVSCDFNGLFLCSSCVLKELLTESLNITRNIDILNVSQGLQGHPRIIHTNSSIIPCYWGHNLLGNAYHLVTKLDLSDTGLQYLPSGMFRHFKSLEILNISHNRISRHESAFSVGLHSLQVLDLSNNSLKFTDFNEFKYYSRPLSHLYLGSNKLSNVSINDVNALKTLEYIDISSNWLNCIDINLKELFVKTNVTIKFNGNPLTCECMKSLQNGTLDNCTCEGNLAKTKGEACYDKSEDDNFGIITFALLLVMLSIAAFIYYIYMWKVNQRCWVCNAFDQTEQSSDDRVFVNHAYIVCDDNDLKILKSIILQLETKRQMKLLCDARDAPAGEFLVKYIETWLSTSKRVIFVLSSSFLRNNLCLYILQMAKSFEFLEQQNVIIILKVKALSREDKELQKKLSFGKICYQYPSDAETNELFWDTLAQDIKDPKLHCQIYHNLL